MKEVASRVYDLPMLSKTVAILETRAGAHLAELIERRGARALLAPALEEVPDVDSAELESLLKEWRAEPFGMVIFQTGVGTKALFAATDALGSSGEWLELLIPARVVVRGPKPVGELNVRGVRIDIRAATPFTTDTVLAAISAEPVSGCKVLVQRYGAANAQLREALVQRGATVRELATYRWALPKDLSPLHDLIDALARRQVDAAVFTSAVQVHNLFTVAQQSDRTSELNQALHEIIIASIGPVCSRTLREYGITPSFEASPPKLGPLMVALDAALA